MIDQKGEIKRMAKDVAAARAALNSGYCLANESRCVSGAHQLICEARQKLHSAAALLMLAAEDKEP